MKVNDIVNEGIFGDLQALGKQAQQDQKSAIKGAWQKGVDAVTPQAVKDLRGRVAQFRRTQETSTLARALDAQWQKELASLQGPGRAPLSPAEYQQRFSAWLEQAMHGEVAVDETKPEFQKYINGATPNVIGYLSDYFIPAYQAMKASGPPQIPNGTKVGVRGMQAGKTRIPNEVYTWTNGRWVDSKNQPVTAGSTLHQGLTADAINNLRGARATSQTI